ncbi:unnamed protein product [Mycena citricolor]|uniref:Fungal lipase-type domain-containing protein n=1 Tax=Mycena citricolor TaxID=2018698 RepID=A0AAD2HML3_9AGAR|nr:unnamed protein product [Mycena citricolor]
MRFTASATLFFLSGLFTAHASPVTRETITALSAQQVDAFTPFTHYAAAGYCAPNVTMAWDCGISCNALPGFKTVGAGGNGDTVQYWYVGYDPALQTVIVSHQGTVPAHIQSLITDLRFFLRHLDPTIFPGLPSDIEVHTGFADEHAKTAADVLAAVKTALSESGFTKVTIAGHSLGAALGLLESVYLPLHIPNVTFQSVLYGLPRVGNSAFAHYASQGDTITHINNMEDFVPVLPPRFVGYQHPTGEIHIQDTGEWHPCSGYDNTSDLCSTGDLKILIEFNVNNHLGPYNGITMGCQH